MQSENGNKMFHINEDLQNSLIDKASRAIEKWGEESQYHMLQEECTELNLELVRAYRNRHSHENILEETVDVYIMVHEMILIYGKEEFEKMLKKKLNKFEERLNDK